MPNKETAGGIIVNELHELVLVLPDKSNWQFPKGTVEIGESYFETALREIEEETGLVDIKYVQQLPMYTRPSNNGKILKDIYYFLFTTKKQDVKPLMEVIECKWVAIDNVEDMLTYEEDKAFFRSIKQKILSCPA